MRTVIIKKGKWIEGIPDSLNLVCSVCKEHPYIDYMVDDEIWNQLIDEQDKRGVVCLRCLDKIAIKAGINISQHLKEMFYCGEQKTIEMVPIIVYDWKDFIDKNENN